MSMQILKYFEYLEKGKTGEHIRRGSKKRGEREKIWKIRKEIENKVWVILEGES